MRKYGNGALRFHSCKALIFPTGILRAREGESRCRVYSSYCIVRHCSRICRFLLTLAAGRVEAFPGRADGPF